MLIRRIQANGYQHFKIKTRGYLWRLRSYEAKQSICARKRTSFPLIHSVCKWCFAQTDCCPPEGLDMSLRTRSIHLFVFLIKNVAFICVFNLILLLFTYLFYVCVNWYMHVWKGVCLCMFCSSVGYIVFEYCIVLYIVHQLYCTSSWCGVKTIFFVCMYMLLFYHTQSAGDQSLGFC